MTDDEAVRHVIVKLVRSNEPVDRLILEGEALYSRIAQEIGLNVDEPSTYAESVLIIPRFDRKKKKVAEPLGWAKKAWYPRSALLILVMSARTRPTSTFCAIILPILSRTLSNT